jgi:ubiquitin carboxyl-terminal hydrolase 7
MRFQYDPVSERTVKINDKFEFPENLDLSDFIDVAKDDKSENRENCQYLLHAVLVRNPFFKVLNL